MEGDQLLDSDASPNPLASADSRGHTSPEVDPCVGGAGHGVTEEGVGQGKNRLPAWKEVKQLRDQNMRHATKTGAIFAPSRTSEGWSVPVGKQMSCLPDAAYNGMNEIGFSDASLAKLRSASIPKLGNDPMASWTSVNFALDKHGYPFHLKERTSDFNGKGGIMLNLLTSPPGHVFCVSLNVVVAGKINHHCVVFSTMKKRDSPFGKMIDNRAFPVVPMYLEKKDVRNVGKEAAKAVWKKFIGQNPATHGHDFYINPSQVFELLRV